MTPTAPPPFTPTSHHDQLAHLHSRYATFTAPQTGPYIPFTYPLGTLGILPVIIYLLIPHVRPYRPWLARARYLVFLWTLGFGVWTLGWVRARGMAAGLGTGLAAAWSVVWVGCCLVVRDAQGEFMRTERLEGVVDSGVGDGEKTVGGNESGEEVKRRKTTNPEHTNGSANDASRNEKIEGKLPLPRRTGPFTWQPYPIHLFTARLNWVLDLLSNFRGASWNWRSSALPPPPKSVQTDLLQYSSPDLIPRASFRVHTGQVRTYTTKRELLWANARTFVIGYLTLDFIKTIMMHDPYFWGLTSSPPPNPHPLLPHLITRSPPLTHIYRLTLCMLGVKSALQTIFALAPFFFPHIPSLFSPTAREPWAYPDSWATYTVVLEHGLGGWWGSWWHQTFRAAFEAPARSLCAYLGWERRGAKAKVVGVLIAFGLSGVLHASGSFTCLGPTRPLRGPMVFFLLQALGVLAESYGAALLHRCTPLPRTAPRGLKRVCRFAYVHVWFYFTAHLLCDDFSRGGVWLFEPVPVSIFRGLGYGPDRRDGWWCWGQSGKMVWWEGGRGWGSGLAI